MKSPKHLLLIAILFISVGMYGQHIQLAGNSLNEYPWFEFVKAFNENTTVELAIDPAPPHGNNRTDSRHIYR